MTKSMGKDKNYGLMDQHLMEYLKTEPNMGKELNFIIYNILLYIINIINLKVY
jgi:hypothetical protein